MKSIKTADTYIAAAPRDAQEKLEKLGVISKAAAPPAEVFGLAFT